MPDGSTFKLLAAVALIAEDRVLLVRYKDKNKYDHERGWFLPDDVLVTFEHPDDAARRILSAQLNCDIENVRLSHVESFKGKGGAWYLVFHYKIVLLTIPVLEPSEDLETFQWFPFDQLPNRSEVAHQGWALDVLGRMS